MKQRRLAFRGCAFAPQNALNLREILPHRTDARPPPGMILPIFHIVFVLRRFFLRRGHGQLTALGLREIVCPQIPPPPPAEKLTVKMIGRSTIA